MIRKLCRRCGKPVTTKSENIYCQYCIATTLEDIRPAPEYKPKKKEEPQIMKDVRAAKEHGMSYGDWMASDERRTGE